MAFELVAILLSIALFGIPLLAWIALRRISAADRARTDTEDMKALENSLSLMIKELQDSVEKALSDMEDAALRLNQVIEKADDRLRQLDYYYEYGDELKPLVGPSAPTSTPVAASAAAAPSTHEEPQPARSSHGLKHKEVHELSRKGWSAAQIARHTGMSADEVQLIVNLMEISTMSAHSQNPEQRQSMM